jgi:putative photosynthetic complex assembly protein
MTTLFAQNPFGKTAPIAALLAAGAVVALTAMMKDRGDGVVIASPAAETRLLRFSDAPGGVVKVESVDGVVVASYGSGEGSFLRGVLRSFARDRRGSDVATDVPFELTRHADGRTSLKDTASGQIVVLDAFGTTNAAFFASLLRNGKDKP